MRSFDRGAASFLDSSHLVVAHYTEVDESAPAPSPSEASVDAQQPLFVGWSRMAESRAAQLRLALGPSSGSGSFSGYL